MGENITYEVLKECGVLSTSKAGWTKELRLINWNNSAQPKFDIRDWSPDNSKMGKGLTLSKEEMVALKKLLNEMTDL